MNNSYFWNYLELPTPVIMSYKLTCRKSDKVIAELTQLMNSVKKTFKDLNQLHLEAAALSRFLYREKFKLRQEKSFKALKKINRCLTNYLTMNLPFVLSSIRDSLHDDVGPTRQMVEWALVRMLGVAHLFHRVYHLCIDAAGHLYVKIKLAHLLELTFFSIALVSRIWTFSQFLVRQACEWYQSLYQYIEVLEPSPVPWLPEGCTLPLTAVKTLNKPHYLKLNQIQKPSKLLSELKTPISDDDKKELKKNISGIMDIDDLGESIPRDLLEKNQNYVKEESEIVSHSQENHVKLIKMHRKIQEVRYCKKKYKHSADSIQSGNDLIKFFQVEFPLQNASSNSEQRTKQHQSLLGHLDKLQLLMIKKFLKKQIKSVKKANQEGFKKSEQKLLKSVRENIIKWIS